MFSFVLCIRSILTSCEHMENPTKRCRATVATARRKTSSRTVTYVKMSAGETEFANGSLRYARTSLIRYCDYDGSKRFTIVFMSTSGEMSNDEVRTHRQRETTRAHVPAKTMASLSSDRINLESISRSHALYCSIAISPSFFPSLSLSFSPSFVSDGSGRIFAHDVRGYSPLV